MFALTVTPWLLALVLQTQIAYVTVWPGRMWAALEKAWTETHSWGFLGLGLLEGEGLGDVLGLGLGLGLPVGLGLGVGLGLVPVGLLLGVGLVLALGLVLGDAVPLAVGPGLDGGLAFADALSLAEGLALGLAVPEVRAVTEISSMPDNEAVLFALAVSVGRAPQGDLELGGGTSRVPARATPNMLHERMEIPANVLSATAPACRLFTGTAAPRWTSPRGLVCSPCLPHYASSGENSPPCLFDT